MKYFRTTYLLMLAVLLGGLCSADEEEYAATQYSRDEKLRVWCLASKDLPTLYHISRTCFSEVRKWLKNSSRRPKTEIQIYFTDKPVAEARNPFAAKIKIFQGDSPENIYCGLIAAAIGRHLEENCQGQDRNIPSLGWICAGLYHRIYYDGKGFTLRYTPDFRIAREQFEHGFYPSLPLLLEHPVPTDRTRLYQLYSLYCDIFLNVLEEQDPKQQKIIRGFLEFQSFNRPQIESLQFLLKSKIGSEGLEAWYRRQMYEQSGKGIRKAQAETIARELNDIITAPFIDRNRPGEITDRPLYDLPSEQLTRDFLRRRRISLAQLHLRAPLLMQESIYLYTQALDCRTILGMKKEYRKAGRAFAEAYRKQKTAEQLLKRYEKEAAGKSGEFAGDWEIIQSYQNLRQELLPSLNRK